jgi:hypothetical protein
VTVTPTALPPLGADVEAPGTFDVILPVRIGYPAIRDKIKQALAATPMQDTALREVDVYPSSGRLVIGLRVAKPSDGGAGQWVYFSGALQANADNASIGLSGPDVSAPDNASAAEAIRNLVARLSQAISLDYGIASQNLLNAANQRLTRPLKDGFRMEGRLSSIAPAGVALLADGVIVALRASGDLKILYGM